MASNSASSRPAGRSGRVRGRIGSVLVALAIVGAIGAWLAAGDSPGGATAPPDNLLPGEPIIEPVLEVGVMESVARNLVYELPLRGFSEASRRVEVRAETGGLIVSAPVPKGSNIAAGDTLCEIAPGERLALLAQAEARITQFKADAHSTRELATRGFGPEAAATAAEAGLAAAMAEAERIRLDIERTRIAAPFAGILETGSAETGSLLQPGALCATVLDFDPVRVVGFAPERSIDAFRVGQKSSAQLSTGRRIEGTISFVARSAEPRTRTFRVEMTADNADHAVLDGLSAELFLPISRPNAHLVPQSALTLNDSGELGMRIVEDGRARFVSVEVLRDETEGIWISGLPPVAQVIVVGQEFAIDGTEVIPRPAPGFAQR